jgi:leader peptidase (prepilin peptidase)/N-methyltransferase
MLERDWQAQCAELRGEPIPATEQISLVRPRSRCPKCGHAISAIENVPILSYLFLKGRCRGCSSAIGIRYPIVETLSGLVCGYAAWRFGPTALTAAAMLFSWCVIALAFIDLDTQLLPDGITLPLLWAGLLFNAFGGFTDLKSAVLGAAFGYLALWSVYWVFKLLTGKEGMGFGDFKLLAAIGAWFGWQLLPLTILASSLVGALIGIGLILFARHGRNVPIPFGPYLAAAGVVALFWGRSITDGYLHLLRL